MTTATANLENDHVHILRLIDVMEHLTRVSLPNPSHLESIVSIIKTFADGIHHAKEEKILFPKLTERGFSLKQGPIAVMMHDHEQGRAFVAAMANGIALYKAGNNATISQINLNMQHYIDLLRSHIAKENNVLFRLADNVLSTEDQQQMITEFEKEDTTPQNGMLAEDFINQINELVGYYNIH